MKNCKNLKEELIKLGFANYKAILHTADPWAGVPINKPPAPNAHVLTFFYDEFNIGYIFIVGESTPGHWNIHSIEAAVQMDTERNIEGVVVIGKTYQCQDGQLPHMDQMRKDVLELVRIEEINERFFLQKNNKQTSDLSIPKRI